MKIVTKSNRSFCYILLVLVCAALGFGIGIALSENDVNNDYPDLILWLGLPGTLFLRALKCFVLPLVFVNIILSVIEMVNAGKAGKVGLWTIGLYTLTTFLAALEAIVVSILFTPLYSVQSDIVDASEEFLYIECGENMHLKTGADGSVSCAYSILDSNSTDLPPAFQFTIDDVNDVFVKSSDAGNVPDVSISKQIIEGIFIKLVSENITDEFANARFLGVIAFAMVIGVCATKSKRKPKTLVAFLQEINDILVIAITWIVALTPIAVFSMIVSAIGVQSDMAKLFQNVGLLMGATLTTMGMHFLIVYPSVYYALTKENVLKYARYLVPAQTVAFATASSVGTLPVTLECVRKSGMVSDAIRNFVLPVGSTINMDGTALYFPVATVWLATSQGIQVTAVDYVLIAILSTLGSAGTAPVPSASLVFIVTTFNTVFNTTGEPDLFYIMVAIDWLLDRFRTTINVTGDALVTRMVEARAGTGIRGDNNSESKIMKTNIDIKETPDSVISSSSPSSENDDLVQCV